ncbi:threonine--tRNA ligase [Candidatus Methylospira mobilis]|uniref:Threonine--tRNA ligase n=1 Tax=Candidatus Methylospira mobilis TaxID=1808979 RepID=A0A5Q0BG43_9GAMM|nr:threonine--tRNA ligase [Candidatus Methylospira mobilis]QFY42509.1 threonine--tRNA ligase [Candidatus Methylospira mobilis]WNV04383.1 threonine--tRNA ligase [Candidatus Methylospira mobilis]
MLVVTLPDGSQREYGSAVTLLDVAGSIGSGLAKAALAGKVDGKLVDLSYRIEADADVVIVTGRDPEGLEIVRHSCAHLLAQAVKSLYPSAQVTIGPVIENGFYYDFAYERPFTPEDLANIEKKMAELAASDLPVNRHVMMRDEAVTYFQSLGERYKAEIIEDIPPGEELSLYTQGGFTDLCRGPHVPSTGRLKVFKLMKVAGAYWRGDARNDMLQRIYGTAWINQADLKEYLHKLEEADRRDHRKIGKALNLFHVQEEAPGMVFWHPAGWVIWQVLEQYMRQVFLDNGYQEIKTPLIVGRALWEKSGHWEKFQDEMFTTSSEERDFAIKPMNCPCHVQVYNQGLKSYRDLPLRLAEFGSCHRNELSGALHGIMRVRGFTQDDAHIFCTEDQIQDEVVRFIDLLQRVYTDFGFTEILLKLSTRPEKRVGSDEVWDKAEAALQSALDSKGLVWELQPGEGAFYGPKIEFSLKDCIGRVWQCGTVQVDFSMPERLDAVYVADDSSKKTPVMLHRAILGSMERFIGILIEHYAGFFPLWLAPVQIAALSITDAQAGYVEKVAAELRSHGLRVATDLRNEKIGFKIREHTMRHVPYLLVIGEREAETGTVALRTQKGVDLGGFDVSGLINKLVAEVAARSAAIL